MADYRTWLSDLTDWLKDVKEHEVKAAVKRFIESEQALKDLGEEKYQLYRNYLMRDISHLQENNSYYNSLAWQELKESLWFELSHIEDKTQLEWQSLSEDFKHNGVYHATQILPCIECDGIYFSRKALHP